MTRFGFTLDSYLFAGPAYVEKVNQIGIQLLSIFEKLHSIGYIHNDIKADNICVGYHLEAHPTWVKLIDFGMSSKYLQQDQTHIKRSKTKFRGNVVFSSAS